MAKPVLAIVGRPNVGKSSLFNRLVGEQMAIVQDQPGTTRDRLYGDAEWNGVEFTVIDTGGLVLDETLPGEIELSSEEIVRRTREQAQAAIEEADVVLFINPDTEPRPEQLTTLVADLAADPGLAAVAATTHLPDGRLEHGVFS